MSLSEANVFFIFRNDSTEVKCRINNLKVVNPERYRLTKKEVRGIRKFFIGIERINVTYIPYKKRKRNKV